MWHVTILQTYGSVGDHYKWRAMRAQGIEEQYITGDAAPLDKFKNGQKH